MSKTSNSGLSASGSQNKAAPVKKKTSSAPKTTAPSETPSTPKKRAPKPPVVKEEAPVVKEQGADKVAVFSNRNLYSSASGKLVKGYNILKKEAADYWLTLKGVRIATPEEVAQHYGVTK